MTLVNAVLYGADDVVGALVRARLRQGLVPDFELPPAALDGRRMFAALGVVRDGTLLGGVVYFNLRTVRDRAVCIEAVIAFDRPNWADRNTLWQLCAYPFAAPPLGLGCATGIVQIRRRHARSRALVERLGFKLVGPVPRAFDGYEDVMVYAMTADKCRWLKEGGNVA